ncbi:hypothetical protein CAPTEDRAFT_203754 [Capitella teleta]|uniref:HTH cro/C1-type domain-containing protein n=1 Tax=Capitella teleta TaxID=283909 RepID=R7VD37_CAPTE|nr:hypothetical protein CAPTEDRAFT_203754 [Capitella teleta]|eukprot:ELU16559.1 hypothetical protein CAPTEDRAFT_203754 [Capitella teleta]
MDTIGDRLRFARESANDRLGRKFKITQSELADMMGVTQPSVNKIETNKLKRGEIDVIKLMDAAKYLKASFLWLATGNGSMEQEDSRLLQDLEFQKGFPVYWPQDLNSSVRQPQFYMNAAPLLHERLSKNAFFTLVNDDGMNPHINMGDLVLVDPGGSLQVGSYVLARMPGQKNPMLRRIVENEEDGYLLKAINPDFKTRELEKLDDLIGVAVEFRSFLLPAISYKSELGGGRPLNIIDFKKG